MQTKIAAAAATIFLASGGAASAECGEVTITEMDWASSAVVTAVAKFLMEEGYGCDVTTFPSSTNPAITSVAETGTPDILTELWVNTAPGYPELRDAGSINPLTSVLSDGGEEGWWIPQYLADAHPELTTLEGVLANAELLGGRFHNCPDGWACRIVNDNLAEAVDLEGAGFEIFNHGSGETLATSIAAAYESEEPWIGYYWAPTSILGQYPMVMVDMGDFDADVHACNTDPDCAEPAVSPYPVADVLTVVTTTFADREPDVAELMTNISFTNAQMGALLAWQEEENASAEEAAVHFLTTYSDVWAAWLNDEARENLSALIQ
ncbi:MAG: glycine betaine ABC transporter substrate-binding protein [Pseudomonadota bacterium]